MANRKGDWRDLLSAWSMALDAKKLYLGFKGAVATVLIVVCAAMAYEILLGPYSLGGLGDVHGPGYVMKRYFILGQGAAVLARFAPLLNPFHAGLAHFALSIAFYIALLRVWSYFGGGITRLTALEYAKDALPTTREAMDMVKSKRDVYFFSLLTPLLGVVFLAALNALGGLITNIPFLGPVLLVFPGALLVPMATVVLVFIVVVGLLSFCLVIPGVSISGKDAFESWSSAYSYILWGFNHFLCYAVIAVLTGVLATVAVCWVTEFFIYSAVQTVSFGLIRPGAWAAYLPYALGDVGGAVVPPHIVWGTASSLVSALGTIIFLAVLMLARTLPLAYAFSFFFTAGTIMCFLMRKRVDRIEVDEIYEEEQKEEETSEESAAEEPEAPLEEPAPAEEGAADVPQEGETPATEAGPEEGPREYTEEDGDETRD